MVVVGMAGRSWLGRGMRELSGVITMFCILKEADFTGICMHLSGLSVNVQQIFVHFILRKFYRKNYKHILNSNNAHAAIFKGSVLTSAITFNA